MTNAEKWNRQIANILKEIDQTKWSKEVQHMILELKALLWTATDVCWDIAAIENKYADYCGYCLHRIDETKYRSQITGDTYCSKECMQSGELNNKQSRRCEMKRELYQCSVTIKDEESGESRLQNIYFDSLVEAAQFAHSHDAKTIRRIVGDMEIAETYEWKSQEREIKVIQYVWDWYPIGKEM